MQEVVLVIHLILAVVIIGLVLLQRSSGGGLGVGGGGMGDFASARSTANALTKATTICALLFFATSITLAVIAKHSGERKGLLESYSSTPALPIPAAPVVPATPEPPVPAQ